VLLYELLSGRMPFDLKRLTDSAAEEIRRIIREEEARSPSAALKAVTPEERATIAENRATDFHHLASQLSGDLDWIVMKAMEKERSRRYDTPIGMAMDVQRYLNDEPVLARPPSRAYLFGKLVRRNKLIFAGGSIAIFGLLGGFGASTAMYFREKAARQEQVRLREKAEIRGLVAHAAVKIKYGDQAGADELLAKVPAGQTPSSLEAAQAFAAVAEWHVHAGRMSEAAARYTSMARAIASVDSSDLPSVSFNMLPAAAAVAYSGGAQPYDEVRRMAIERFGGTANLAVAEQTLKASLLLPADQKILKSLAPLARLVEKKTVPGRGVIGVDEAQFNGWVFFALSLAHYRAGEYRRADEWAEESLDFPTGNGARTASALIVRAMAEWRLGEHGNAHAALAQARAAVRDAFASDKWRYDASPAYWFDWVNAAVLLAEAEKLIGSK